MTTHDLEAENAKLRTLNAQLIGRIAAAAEVLGAVAGRKPLCRCQIEAAQRKAECVTEVKCDRSGPFG